MWYSAGETYEPNVIGYAESDDGVVFRKAPVDLVLIDYHQLIRTGKNEDRAVISVRLKQLARYLRCPIIVLCQLDQSIDLRNDRKPLLSDLENIGEMNHYADKVLLMYREDYYSIDTDNKGIFK